jgi:hypothetical protein
VTRPARVFGRARICIAALMLAAFATKVTPAAGTAGQLTGLSRKEQMALLLLKDLLGPDGRPNWLAEERIICVVVEDDPAFGWSNPSPAFLDLFGTEMKKRGAGDLTFTMGSNCIKDPDMPRVMTFDYELASYLVAEIQSEHADGRSEWFVHGFNGERGGGATYQVIDQGGELTFSFIKSYP